MSRAKARTPVPADQLPPVVHDAIARLLEYNWASEERDYAECGPGGNSRQGHIYLDLVLLGRWMGSCDSQEAAASLDSLKVGAARLGTEIDELIEWWDAVEEVDTNLGVDVEEAGRHLESLAGKLAAAVGQADPQAARQLLQSAARLGEAVDYYAGLDEHDTNASIDIVDQLGPAIALVQRAIQAQENGTPPATRH